LVSPDPSKWNAFTDALQETLPIDVLRARDGHHALEAARKQKVLAAIVDSPLPDMTGIMFVQRLMEIDAMIHVALVSDQPADDFHTQTEGLGIILQLPSSCQPLHADALAKRLRELDRTQ
jgi:DNA-binding response OmpR family regulator